MSVEVVGAAMDSLATRSPWMPVWAFLAGAITSAGPCGAPRLLAAAGLARGGGRRGAARIACLGCGIVVGGGGIAFCASSVMRTISVSSATYAVLAALFSVSGAVALWRGNNHTCASENRRESLGGAFLQGATCSTVASPCCTPFLVTVAGSSGDAFAGISAAVAFSIGHALPVCCAGIGLNAIARALRGECAQAVNVVCGALTLALGAYYALLI